MGTWCATCPDADHKRNQVTAVNNKVIAVTVHQSDPMTISLFGSLNSVFSGNSPSGMVNRTPSLGNVILSPSQWMSNASVAAGGSAVAGLAITSSMSGSTAQVEVHAGFNSTLSGDHRLAVYLVEDSVTGTASGYQQMNAYNNSSGSPYYNMGNPIQDYKHSRVVRKVLTADLGDAIPAAKLTAGGDHKVEFSNVDLSGYNKAFLFVVAYVHRFGASATTHEVLNVQAVKVGATRDWD